LTAPVSDKRALRRYLTTARQARGDAERMAAQAVITTHLLGGLESVLCVAAFLPLPSEPLDRELIRTLADQVRVLRWSQVCRRWIGVSSRPSPVQGSCKSAGIVLIAAAMALSLRAVNGEPCPGLAGGGDHVPAVELKPLRQTVESVFDTYKGQLDLEQHGGRTPSGVVTRIWQRILALTAVIWHNDTIAAPIKRSLIAYDH